MSDAHVHDTPARMSLRCLFGRHRPRGRRAYWNGETYLSRCEFCHQPIKRLSKGRWRLNR